MITTFINAENEKPYHNFKFKEQESIPWSATDFVANHVMEAVRKPHQKEI